MNRWMVTALCGAMAIGCGASNDGGVNTPVDSGVSGGTDVGTMTDRGTTATTDRGTTPTTDRGATTDRGSTTPDSGTPSQFGICGEALNTALCTCGMDANCQQTALNAAFMRSSTCQTCYTNGISACCPDEVMAIQTCATDNGCMDQACLQARCATQFTAANTCLMTAQQSNATCQTAFRRCFGPAFPMIACE